MTMRLALALSILLGLGACHSPPRVAGKARPAPALTSVPSGATYAWVRPLELYPNSTTENDASAGTGAVRSMRLDVDAVLTARQWVEVRPESAQFVATLLLARRETPRMENRPQSTGVAPPRVPCDATRSGPPCINQSATRTVAVRVVDSEERAVLLLHRRADGARREWDVLYTGPKAVGATFAREVLLLLLSPQGLPSTKPEEAGLSTTALLRIAPMLQAQVDSQHFSGFAFAVARHGKLAFSGAVGSMNTPRALPMRTDALFRIFSMTKAVTAAAVMQQVERGHLRLSDPVAKYIPAFAQVRVFAGGSVAAPTLVDPAHPVTIEHLLLHTAGLTYGVFGNSPVDSMYRVTRLLVAGNTIAQFANQVATLPLLFQPGTKFNYSMSMDVLARVVEVASGKPYDRYLADELFAPLGMKETAHHVAPAQERRVVVMDYRGPDNRLRPGRDTITPDLRDEGQLFAGGQGLVTTMADYLRFTQMLLNGGTLDGHRVLKRESVASMMKDHLPSQLSPLPKEETIGIGGYGQGYGGIVLVDSAVSQMPASPGTYRWCGYAGTYFWIDPRRELIALLWGQLGGGCPHPVVHQFERMVYAAVTGR